MADRPEYPGAPRWVKVAGAIAVALILILLLLLLLRDPAGHGPGRHLSLESGVEVGAAFNSG